MDRYRRREESQKELSSAIKARNMSNQERYPYPSDSEKGSRHVTGGRGYPGVER